MASVNSTSNYYSQLVAKNKGIGGLATGLDTNALMEALTAGTRAKIAKQGQLRQLTVWKQDAYRSAVTALNAFQTKWLSTKALDTASNLKSGSFFSAFKATTTSKKVNVTTTANSSVGDITINRITQLAQAHVIEGKSAMQQELKAGKQIFDSSGTRLVDFKDQTLSLNVDGVVKNIKLDTLNSSTSTSFEADLQALIDAPTAFGTKGGGQSIVDVTLGSDGKLSFTYDTGKVSVAASNTELDLSLGDSNRIDTDKTTLGSLVANGGGKLVGNTFTFNINGTEITAKATDTIGSLMSKINSSAAGVRMSYSNITGKFEMASKVSGHLNYIDMTDVQGNLMNQMFGAKSATSMTSSQLYKTAEFTGAAPPDFATRYNTARSSGDPAAMEAFVNELSLYQFSMTIGDASGGYKTATVKPVISDALKTKMLAGDFLTDDELYNGLADSFNAGIKKSFSGETEVKFTFDATGTFTLDKPDNRRVEMKPGSGVTNGLAALGFNQASYSNVVDFTNGAAIQGGTFDLNDLAGMVGKTLEYKLSVNGVEKTVGYTVTQADVDKLGTSPTAGSAAKMLATKLNTALSGISELEGTAYTKDGSLVTLMVAFEADSNGKIKLTTDKGLDVRVSNGTSDASHVNALSAFGIADNASNINANLSSVSLAELGITGGTLSVNNKNITVNASDSVQDLLDKINTEVGAGTAKIVDNKLVIDGGDSLKLSESGGSNILSKMFGLSASGYETQTNSFKTTTQARSAEIEITIDGQTKTMFSNTNTFDFGGTRVEVTEESAGDEPIKISVASDPDKLIEKLQSFIEDYNALISTLNGMIREKGDSDYQPLTDEQKADMSKEEIEKWEAEAKKGILRYDPTLTGVLGQLRTSLYKGVGPNNLSLYSIGITTVSVIDGGAANFGKDGHIEIREENLEKLRNAIINDPDSVKEIFTHAVEKEEGLAILLDNAIKRATDTSSDPEKRGSLIAIAGTEILTGDNKSTLGNKIKSYDEAIALLNTRLETEYNRYWKQFSALETAIQRFSAQSSWLTQLTGG